MITALVLLSGCDEKSSDPRQGTDKDERELLDPEEKKKAFLRRCTGQGREVALRASGSGLGAAVEVGDAVALEGGFAVAALEVGKESHVSVSFLDGQGAFKRTDLGRVHGSVQPPGLFSFGDQRVFVALVDNDAGHTRLRLARIDEPQTGQGVVWGPEVQVRRGETNSFSLVGFQANGKPQLLLAWDDYDKASLRSQIRGLSVDAQTMKPVGAEFALSPADEDAGVPRLAQESDGIWLTWVRYGDLEKGLPGAPGLVDEAPGALRAVRLDGAKLPSSEPLTISAPGQNVVAYEVETKVTGELVVAYRATSDGRAEGASPILVRIVGRGGGVVEGAVEAQNLGLGAPLLLGAPESPVWVTARGYESDVLLGELTDQALSTDFQPEEGLQRRMPLVRNAQQMLVMRPDGLDMKLATLKCTLGNEKSTSKKAPAAK